MHTHVGAHSPKMHTNSVHTQPQAGTPLVCPGAEGRTKLGVKVWRSGTRSPHHTRSLTLGMEDAQNEGPQNCGDHESQGQEEKSPSPASAVPLNNNGLLGPSCTRTILDPWARRAEPWTLKFLPGNWDSERLSNLYGHTALKWQS